MWAVPSSPLQPHQETEQCPALPKPGRSKPKWSSAPIGREDPGARWGGRWALGAFPGAKVHGKMWSPPSETLLRWAGDGGGGQH